MDSLEAMCGWKVLVESIIRQLKETDRTNQRTTRRRTQQMQEVADDLLNGLDSFVSRLQRLIGEQEPVVLIVDKAEILRGFNDDMLHTLLHLREYTERNICVVLLSNLPWMCYSHVAECSPPIQLHFPQYTEEETTRIILGAPPPGVNPQVFQFYVKMVVTVHYSACRNLKKLWKLVKMQQKEFLGHFDSFNGNVSQRMLSNMWKTLSPLLRADFTKLSRDRHEDRAVWGGASEAGKVTDPYTDVAEMPRSWVYLLIAAFIASVNPPASDKRFFVKAKVSGGGAGQRKGTEIRTHKGIPHSRLLAIFSQISESEYPLDTCILASLATLCRRHYLSVTASDIALNEPKYCLQLSEQCIQKLCLGVDLKLEQLIFQ